MFLHLFVALALHWVLAVLNFRDVLIRSAIIYLLGLGTNSCRNVKWKHQKKSK